MSETPRTNTIAPVGYARAQDLLLYREVWAGYSNKPADENGHPPVALYTQDQVNAMLAAERERADRLQIAVDGASGLLTCAAYGADRCCNRPCHEVEEMVRRSTQMRAWVLKYGKWKMGIAYPETEAAISASIDAARRK